MSGPKTSRYTLTYRQSQILMEQRRREQERIQLENWRKIVFSTTGQVKREIMQMNRVMEQIEPLLQETGTRLESVEQGKTLCAEASVAVVHAADGNDTALLQSRNHQMKGLSLRIESLTRTLQREFSAADRTFRTETAEQIDKGFLISFGEPDMEKRGQDRYYQKIQTELGSLAACSLSAEHTERLQDIRVLAGEITSIDFLKNFYVMTVVPFVSQCLYGCRRNIKREPVSFLKQVLCFGYIPILLSGIS